jgi:hypothetical protein
MFNADLFIKGKIRKQPKCPSMGKWIKYYTSMPGNLTAQQYKKECTIVRYRNREKFQIIMLSERRSTNRSIN